MIRFVGSVVVVLGCAGFAACSSNPSTFGDQPDSGYTVLPDGAIISNDDAGNNGLKDGASMDASPGVSVIYAHTDTELYTMDPMTQKVTDVGPFDDGSGQPIVVTDLAVNQSGAVYVCTETALYTAAVPTTPGKVSITKVATIQGGTSQKFYALGFAPAGALGTAETLVAGDNLGELYAVESTGTLTDLGSFGSAGSAGTYELSGDVTFFTYKGAPRGIATVRIYKSGSPTSTNDLLAEIDMAAMQTAYSSKTKATSLKKAFYGTGTGFGKLFGVGAWNDSVYAFSRNTGTTVQAQLIQIDSTGVGKSIQSFSTITAGWSGAGVTTAATVTVVPPN